MKLYLIASFFTLIFTTVLHSQSFPILRTQDKITIDGNLAEWDKPFFGPFVIHNSGEKAIQNTMVSFLWNDENLYIAYRCEDSQIVGSYKPKNSKIYETDDLVEIFIDPDGDGKNYIEIGVNAFSTNYDLLLKCISEECGGWKTSMDFDIAGLESVSKIDKSSYSVEIKIPFSSLEKVSNGGFSKPRIGTKWRGNAFRIDYGNTTEYLALQPYKSLKFGFHQPQEFAVFEFVK